MKSFLQLVSYLRQFTALQIFTIYLRYLIGGAFVMAAVGMDKLALSPRPVASTENTPLDELQPFQLFFRVMAESGLYWNFIGWVQLLAGSLLMTQRFATLGATMFFGMILNIFVITLSYDFRGTPIITGLMLLATIFLLLWEAERWLFLIKPYSTEKQHSVPVFDLMRKPYWEILGLVFWLIIIGFYWAGYDLRFQLSACFLLGLGAFIWFLISQKKQKIQKL